MITTSNRRPAGRRVPNERGEWRCVRCDRYLPATAFNVNRKKEKPLSYCRPCDVERIRERRRRDRTFRLGIVRGVLDYGREDRCIVWETGPEGFCEFVTADHCPCQVFRASGTCRHLEAAIRTIRTHERSAA